LTLKSRNLEDRGNFGYGNVLSLYYGIVIIGLLCLLFDIADSSEFLEGLIYETKAVSPPQ
jgi:hypothetical protein